MNMNLIQSISALSGIITTGTVLIIAIVGSFYVVKNGINKTTNDAQQNAIVALQSQVTSLKSRVDDLTKENARLDKIVETICSALKTRGMLITVQGDFISIENLSDRKTTVARIHDGKERG